jgi:rRNA maturation endonuclease Nob1
MSPLNRNMKLSIQCPKCEEVFKETIALLKMNPTPICPICGPVQVEADEFRRTLQQVERMLSDLERISGN